MSARTIPLWKIVAVCVGLATLTWIVFGQTVSFQFVNFDDGAYVYRNSQVMRGISLQGIKWAFTHPVAGNWHPLTVLSHMLDCQFYGVAPMGHHFTNTALHSIAVVLLFLAIWQMTAALWRSAIVAAIFAVHPLHVESVTWIAERKDVLSGVFFMLTLIAYAWYAQRPSTLRYALMSILFAAGLMAKPMLVTLPFVLLLLDYWPLKRFARVRSVGASPASLRFEPRPWTRLVAEKVPLLVLSAAASAGTLITQAREISAANHLPLVSRIANAFVSLLVYLRQTVWPQNLAVFYPQNALPIWEVAFAIAMLVVISAAIFVSRNERPYLLTGWLWFIGMLVPVIGIVQVGIQAHADRYTYLPQIGLCLGLTWGIADLLATYRYRQLILGAVSFAALIAFAWPAYIQAAYWRSSERLWERAIAVTSQNENAYEHLSEAYLKTARIDDAVVAARHAVDSQPDSADAHGVLGAALARKGRLDEALEHLEKAVQLNPQLARVHFNLGNTLVERGQMADAISNYETELRLYPSFPEAHSNLANAFLRIGKPDEALGHLRTALQLNPNDPKAHNNLAIALSQKGQMREAIGEWEETLLIDPNNIEAQCNLAWVLSTFPDPAIRNASHAIELAQRAVQLSGGKNARVWRIAAAAYAEAGQFSEAIKAAQSGLAIAENEGNSTLVQTLRANIQLFEQGSPLRD